ncbi:hypothetical protein PABY_10950 [Pyrodictium abyssi]|uniref:Uncharacterized protein n=1 Tax=Pyrodictium abyssi TaxID=54256 RepID=A0ABN6ZMS4_9CREN|nr:hypothetical protein PABY_10950 [Pyrodictium abyssi]
MHEECREWRVKRSRHARRWLKRHPEAAAYYEQARQLLMENPYAGSRCTAAAGASTGYG